VKYITAENNINDVEGLMECVNNYLIFKVDDGISNTTYMTNRKIRIHNMIEYLNNVNEFYNIDTNREINSHRKYVGKILVFIKKVIRKVSKWYINSVFDQQRLYNANVARYLNELTLIIKDLNDENLDIRKKNIELEIELKKMQDKH
jgi:hypothetical protein